MATEVEAAHQRTKTTLREELDALKIEHELLSKAYQALHTRIEALEQQAHTEHTIGKETLDAIAAHCIGGINAHLRKALGAEEPPTV